MSEAPAGLSLSAALVFETVVLPIGIIAALSLSQRDRPDLAVGRNNLGALDNLRAAVLVKHRNERLADCELCKHCLGLQFWILPKDFRGGFHRFLAAVRKRPQRMLHAVAQPP
jgi:hypothetical protein